MAVIRSISDFQVASAAIHLAMREVIADSLQELVGQIRGRTPVDTSRLVRNWQVTYGAEANSPVRGFSGELNLDNLMSLVPQITPGFAQRYYITNLVPYAEDVEFKGGTFTGTGTRPSFMARVPIQRWDRIVEMAAKGHKI